MYQWYLEVLDPYIYFEKSQMWKLMAPAAITHHFLSLIRWVKQI